MVTPKKDKDLERRQLKLEEGFVEAGVKRLRRRERDLARKSGLGKTRAGRDLLRECFTQLEQAIVTSQEEVLRAQHLPPAALPLLGLDAGTLAFVCLHVAVGAMRDKDVQEGRWPALSNLSREVGQRCQRERKLVVKAKRAPDVTKRLLLRNKNVWNAAVRAARLAAELDSDWSTEVALHLGSKLLYLAIRHCKLDGKPVFERCRAPKGRGQAKVIYLALGLTDAGVQWLDVRQRAM